MMKGLSFNSFNPNDVANIIGPGITAPGRVVAEMTGFVGTPIQNTVNIWIIGIAAAGERAAGHGIPGRFARRILNRNVGPNDATAFNDAQQQQQQNGQYQSELTIA
jgi:hypothetical protein